MNKHARHVRRLVERRSALFAAAALFLLFVAGFAQLSRIALVSPEVKFTDASASGLSIVPASCPSNPGDADAPNGCSGASALCPDGSAAPNNDVTQCTCAQGNQSQCGVTSVAYCSDGSPAPNNNVSQCSGGNGPLCLDGSSAPNGTVSQCQLPASPATGCTIESQPAIAASGQYITLGWTTGCSPSYGCYHLGVPVVPENTSIDNGVGSVGASGITSLIFSSSLPVTYTLSGTYYASIFVLNLPLDSFSCQTTIGTVPPQSPQQCKYLKQDTCVDPATIRHYNNDANCSYTDVTCPYAAEGYGCSTGTCLTPPQATAHISVQPGLVHPGATVQIHWSLGPATSCSITGTNGDSWNNLSGSGSVSTQPIVSQTIYTMNCSEDVTGDVIPPQSVTVNITPSFIEK